MTTAVSSSSRKLLFGRLASPFLSEARVHAAGDKEVLAGDVGGVFRHQEAHHASHLLCLGKPIHKS